MAVFELRKSETGQFSFSFVNEEGKTLLKSEQYSSKAAVQNGIESVRKNSVDDGRYELEKSSNDRFYFNLKAANGQIIGTSPMWGEEAVRNAAVAQLKKDAEKADVVEE